MLFHSSPCHLTERSAILGVVCGFLRHLRSKLAFTVFCKVIIFSDYNIVSVCMKFLILVLQIRKQRMSGVKYCAQDITNKGESQESNPGLSWFSFLYILYILLSGDISNLK